MRDEASLLVVAVLGCLCFAAFVRAAVRLATRRALLRRGPAAPASWGAAAAAGILALFVAAHVAGRLVHNWIADELTPAGSFVALTSLAYAFVLPVVLLVFKLAGKTGSAWEALGIQRVRRGRSFLAGVWLYGLFLPLLVVYRLLLQTAWKVFFEKELPLQKMLDPIADASGFTFAVLVVVVGIVVPLVEELVFRGFVQNGLEKGLGALPGTVLTILLFTLVHGRGGALLVFPVAVVRALAYYWTRDLVLCMGFHAAVNLTSLALVLAMKLAPA